jgi:electron transfer flavoprotein alpha subunit
MKIGVCIKQVPIVAAMKFDAASKTIVRDGVPTEVSAFDVRAMLRAVELREQHGGEVVVVTMGPPQAVEALAECLALGGDRAIHLCDRAFAGSDTLATARVLAAALRREEFDLILCGRHSVDAETGQVGPEIAELLDLPQVTGVRGLDVDPRARRLVAERETDEGVEWLEVPLPALVTAAEDLAPERFTTEAERAAAARQRIDVVDAAALGVEPAQVGLAGSPTWVLGLESARDERRREVLAGDDLEAAVDTLVERLLAAGLFGTWQVERKAPPVTSDGGAAVRAGRSTLVVAEIAAGEVRRVTFELVAKARRLADAHGGTVDVLLAAPDATRHVGRLAASGADRILVAEDDALVLATEPQTALLTDVIRFEQPGLVLLGATSFGRDVAPRVAARLGLGLTGECIDLTVDAEGRVLQHKPAFGGSVVALIASRTTPEMATVRPGMMSAADAPAGHPLAEVVTVAVPELADRVRIVERRADAGEVTDLEGADVVVGFGKGIGGPEGLPLVRELATVVGGVLCTTRDVTDQGWVPKQFQVGMTGRAIAPRLYVAVALRGAFEHMVGTRRAGLIVGINRSRNSPLIKNSDVGLVADWAEALPLLIEKLKAAKDELTTEAQRH